VHVKTKLRSKGSGVRITGGKVVFTYYRLPKGPPVLVQGFIPRPKAAGVRN